MAAAKGSSQCSLLWPLDTSELSSDRADGNIPVTISVRRSAKCQPPDFHKTRNKGAFTEETEIINLKSEEGITF